MTEKNFIIVVTNFTGTHAMTSAQAGEIIGMETIKSMKQETIVQDCPFSIRKINGTTVQVSRFGNGRG